MSATAASSASCASSEGGGAAADPVKAFLIALIVLGALTLLLATLAWGA